MFDNSSASWAHSINSLHRQNSPPFGVRSFDVNHLFRLRFAGFAWPALRLRYKTMPTEKIFSPRPRPFRQAEELIWCFNLSIFNNG